MPEKAPIRPTTLDHLVAWIVVATFLPVEEIYAVVSMLAVFVLWDIWAVRLFGAIMQRTMTPHWSRFVWPAIFRRGRAPHLSERALSVR